MFEFLKKRKKNEGMKTAAVFVDFEHWCYSLDSIFSARAKIEEFYRDISSKYDIKRIYFFGDFTQTKLRAELDNIRKITNNIIDTQNAQSYVKKDFTDFIMLDYIYRDIDDYPETDVYVIFSGDGHFASVAGYLRNKKRKYVCIYGVKKATSNKLKMVASECIEIPDEADEKTKCYIKILENLYIRTGSKGNSTFGKTCEKVSESNEFAYEDVKTALIELIDMGVVEQNLTKINDSITIKALNVNWELARKKKLWNNN